MLAFRFLSSLQIACLQCRDPIETSMACKSTHIAKVNLFKKFRAMFGKKLDLGTTSLIKVFSFQIFVRL